MKKLALFIGIAAIAMVGGFFVLNAYIYAEKQGNPSDITAYRGTLTGTHVCLPHADTTGPQTMECAIGIQTDAGEYYALDFTLMSQTQPDVQNGDRFTATGLITPIELLSTEHWQKYAIEGIFSVTDSVEKL